jgi:rhomboid protease GluP
MTTKTFGKRGAAPRIHSSLLRPSATVAVPATVPAAVAPDPEPGPSTFQGGIPERSLIADLPLLTVGMIVLLMVIFAIEKHSAFDIGKDGLGVRALIADGAVSYDLVIGSGQWWRVALAPLLHASVSHLVGNCFALFFVGMRLEPMVGRGWFALIFMVSALGGVAGSLYGNPHDIPSVGASGAISGLIGALFVVSFHHHADPIEQRYMRRTALRFGIPALLPLIFASSTGGVDYAAHAGGAIAGAAFGLVLCTIWSTHGVRPDFARFAAIAALGGLAISIACGGIAASRYRAYAADAAQFIPSSEMPPTLKTSAKRSADLVARYPKDPRSHLIRAYWFIETNRFAESETELRTAMALAPSDAVGRPVRTQAEAMLAVILLEQGRRNEAMTLASGACRANDQQALKRILDKMKLCG